MKLRLPDCVGRWAKQIVRRTHFFVYDSLSEMLPQDPPEEVCGAMGQTTSETTRIMSENGRDTSCTETSCVSALCELVSFLLLITATWEVTPAAGMCAVVRETRHFAGGWIFLYHICRMRPRLRTQMQLQ
jgi:hypothetical protein